jgi:hypothetical protein
MQQTQTPQIGTAFEGGFFGGVINVNGHHKGVIWAPKKPGSFPAVLLDEDKIVTDAGSPFDCLNNTLALLSAGSHAAKYVTGLKINGFQDWLIPSRDVLELGYRHFKPTTDTNWCSWRDGENHNSVPPGWLYTRQLPSQTSLEAFKAGGDEAFDVVWHWSSTVHPDGDSAFIQHFFLGSQCDSALSAECRVRAVRLIQL